MGGLLGARGDDDRQGGARPAADHLHRHLDLGPAVAHGRALAGHFDDQRAQVMMARAEIGRHAHVDGDLGRVAAGARSPRPRGPGRAASARAPS